MKTEIDAFGILRITSETQLETYALKKWTEENTMKDGTFSLDNVIIDTSFGLENHQNSDST